MSGGSRDEVLTLSSHSEDKKKKQQATNEYTKCIYFSLKQTFLK